MISLNESRDAQCDVRLSLKTQDQTLIRQAMDGAGLTRWEAAVLPRVVEEILYCPEINRNRFVGFCGGRWSRSFRW